MSEKVKKLDKGITLISLVITTILLLLLAGITISSLGGENGLFTKAKKAKEEYEIANAREKLVLAINEYQMAMKKETLRSIIIEIDGFEGLEPDDETGPDYTVVIDGYTFFIDQELNIEYLGKNDGIVPEVEVTKQIVDEQVIIKVNAKTEENEGLKEIRLLKNGQVIETKTLSGEKQKEETFNINKNGTYQIVVVGSNSKQKRSEKIKVTEMSNITASLTSGTMIDAQVLLTVSVEVLEGEVKTIQLYNGNTKVEEKTYTTAESYIEEDITVDLAFYEESNYYAKVIDSADKEVDTEILLLKNEEHIKTETDLKKLAEIVNDGTETFENKTLKQVADITLAKNHTVIGTEDTPFKGIYDGQEKTLNNLRVISSSENNQGLFGYVENATLRNITLETGSIIGSYTVGGICGKSVETIISNCKNIGVTVTGKGYIERSHIWVSSSGSETYDYCEVGGIVGYSYNTNILNCTNSATVSGDYSAIGGIIGADEGNKSREINNCINTANISVTINGKR